MAKEDTPISEVNEEEEVFTENEEDEEDEEYEDEEDESPVTSQSKMRVERTRMEQLLRRMQSESVPLRVHDVIIKGNNKTKESVIEAEVQALKAATSVQELLQATTIANARLQKLDIFDSVTVTLDSGPSELPGTSNVIVEVVEYKNPLTGDIGIFTKPEVVFAWFYFDIYYLIDD